MVTRFELTGSARGRINVYGLTHAGGMYEYDVYRSTIMEIE